MSFALNRKFRTSIFVVAWTLAFCCSFVSESFAFPPFTESEISKTGKSLETNGFFENQIVADSFVKMVYGNLLADVKVAKKTVGRDDSQILGSVAKFFDSDLFNQCYQSALGIIADIKRLYLGSKKELKPVSKYVSKEWQGVKKDLNIKTKSRSNKNIWGTFDSQIKDTKEQFHNFVADPRLLQLKSRFDKGNHKII